MINKRRLWFLTLFSLILVLSVYYITMPSELLLTTNNITDTKEDTEKKTETVSVNDSESAELVALRVEAEEEMLKSMEELKSVLTNNDTSTEEKNDAFNKMQELNQNRGTEESLEKKIEKNLSLKSFVKIDGSNISVVIDSKKHDKKTANQIMRLVQEEFDTSKNISVKFQK